MPKRSRPKRKPAPAPGQTLLRLTRFRQRIADEQPSSSRSPESGTGTSSDLRRGPTPPRDVEPAQEANPEEEVNIGDDAEVLIDVGGVQDVSVVVDSDYEYSSEEESNNVGRGGGGFIAESQGHGSERNLSFEEWPPLQASSSRNNSDSSADSTPSQGDGLLRASTPVEHQNERAGIMLVDLDDGQAEAEADNDIQVIGEVGRQRVQRNPVEVFYDSDDNSEIEVTERGPDSPVVIEQPSAQSSNSDRPSAPPVSNQASGNTEENRDEEDQDGNKSEDNDEESEPPPKMPKLDTSLDDDGFICQICYEPFTNSGGHRVCCLKCGHIYGMECIEKWIVSSKRCPSCNCKAMKKDIRILYTKNLKVMDTTELDRVKAELEKANIAKNSSELSNAKLRCKVDLMSNEILTLQQKLKIYEQQRSADISSDVAVPGPSKGLQDPSSSQTQDVIILRMPKLKLSKHFDIKEGQSRVAAYSEYHNLLVVSHAIHNRLFPSGSYGIKKINSLDMHAFQSFPIHQRALRDMSFSSSQTDLLLTVGLDKKAVLFNCTSNCAVQTFITDHSLWSCCWNTVQEHIFYVGSVNGKVTSYDIRAPQQPLGVLTVPTSDKSGVNRMKFIPPAYQSQSFNMSGLMIQKMNSVWFAEMHGGVTPTTGEPRYHQLPLDGPFLNCDFEVGSRQVLVSCRPKLISAFGEKLGTKHVICNLGKTYSTEEERDLFSCDVVQTFTGGFQESTILCRSTLFSPRQGQTYVAANGEMNKTVRVWDVANAEQKTLLKIQQDAALDFVHGKVNDKTFLGVVTEKSFDAYEVS